MLLPIVLILLAIIAAAFFAYGTQSSWGSYHHGIDLILWSRRLEWPLIVATILLCAGLCFLIISGKRRAWWLIGLLPVATLFYHRLTHAPGAGFGFLQDPVFTLPANARSLAANDLIVGVIVEGQPTAFPCGGLVRWPIVIRTGREKPMILLYTPWAHRAIAFVADRELRAADLQIVSAPSNTFVIYNSRLGEFINSVTGQTFNGATPTGLHAPLAVTKTTWQKWQSIHPDTVVADISGTSSHLFDPVAQKDQLPGTDPALIDTRAVCVVACTQPIAVPSESITDRPLNLTAGQTPFLLVRVNGIVRAFSRELPGDLIPRFSPTVDPKNKNVAWVDSDTSSKWADTGVQIGGPVETHGLALKSIPLEDDLRWNVMKFWYPELRMATASEITQATVIEQHPVEKPVARRHRAAK